MAKLEAVEFQIQKNDLNCCRWVDLADPAKLQLENGQILVAIDRFAFTANNVTYANFGQEMAYWEFFPTHDGQWGKIPVWGFADIIGSAVQGLEVGQRIFGFLPMSGYLLMQPGALSNSGFSDQLPHRQDLHGVYNQYQLILEETGDNGHSEDLQMLLRPLFITSFLIDDFLDDNDFFGADTIVLSSASSKTAMGLAYLLQKNRSEQCRVIGLTSSAHVEYVESLGCYDQVTDYSKIASLPSGIQLVYVDMAGNAQLRHDLHHHFGDHLRHDCVVGNAHGQKPRASADLPGARPEFFFAPARIQKRESDWGRGGVMRQFSGSWLEFLPAVSEWLTVTRHTGREAVERVYLDTLAGKVSPKEGNVLSISAA